MRKMSYNIRSEGNIKKINKTKYFVSCDLTVAQFNLMLKKRHKFDNENDLYQCIQILNTKLYEVYQSTKDPEEDEFLQKYILYSQKTVWGMVRMFIDQFNIIHIHNSH